MNCRRIHPAMGPALLCLLSAGAQLGLLWFTEIPLGIPGEWTWPRIAWSPESGFAMVPALLVGVGLVAFVHCFSPSGGTTSPRRMRLRVAVLWGLGFIWLMCVVAAVPGIAGQSRFPFVLYYNRTSGYFFEARYEVQELVPFLLGYQESIQGDETSDNYLHRGTHPPGLVTGFWGLLKLMDRFPVIRQAVLATEPQAVRDAAAILRANERHANREFRDRDEAVLWLATLLVAGLATFTVWPLHNILSRTECPTVAWYGSALWLTVPAAAVFLPKSDAMFAGLAMSTQWCWLASLDRRSPVWGACAGGVLFLSMTLSLAFAPLGLILILQFLMKSDESGGPPPIVNSYVRSRAWPAAAGATALFAVALALLRGVVGINLPAVWFRNIRNHAEFYEHFTRTWSAWLVESPVELAVAVGSPLAVLAIIGLFSRRPLRHRMDYAALLVWGGLWLSGKNMGEAARLWILLMPYVVWFAGPALERIAGSSRKPRFWLTSLLAIQLAVCLLSAIRVDGFHFADLER